METTVLYAEMIIIGLEASLWIGILSVMLTDLKTWSVIKYLFEKIPAAIFFLGMLYILGITVDRLADLLLSDFEKKIKKESKLDAKSSILIWKNAGQETYFLYTRSRIRILRASVINFPLITLSAFLLTYKLMPQYIFFISFVIFLGFLFTATAFRGYKETVTSYYKKARLLELEAKKARSSPK